MKAEIEKIREDLFVRKHKNGTYEVVYPLRIDNTKSLFAKGNLNKKNLSIVLKKEIGAAIGLLIPFLALLLMLLPGAHQLKEQCEDNIAYLIDNSCDTCTELQINGFDSIFANLSLNKEVNSNVG